MARLNRDFLGKTPSLPGGLQAGSPAPRPVRIVQFGEGNFLRAFVDWMVDLLNEATGFDGSIVAVQPIETGLVDMLNGQDGLYTLLLRGMENGKPTATRRIITSISQGLNPYTQWDSFLQLAASQELRFMVSNTTEAGIAYEPQARPAHACPRSFPAKATAFLHARFQAVGGAADKGMVILPCELIERNGDKLRECILQHARDWELPADFTGWLQQSCVFCNTLVDRIVPGYPREEIQTITAELGYEDTLVDAAELFHLWVIEGPSQLSAELPFHKAGLNVVWTDDMTPYRTRKVRVLNGAHTASVLAAFQCGQDTVGQMVGTPLTANFLHRVVFDEVLPVLQLPQAEKDSFANAVLERFANPFIRHELISISLNSVSKWKVRVLPSLKESRDLTGKLPAAMSFSLAALISFYDGTYDGTEMTGLRDGAPYPIRDSAEVLEFFASVWETHRQDPGVLARQVLARTDFWGEDLNAIDGLAAAVANGLESIATGGMRQAIASVAG